MGTKGKDIVNVDVEKLLVELNKALANEWLAYYQYWIGAQVVKGPMRDTAVKELLEHAEDEFKHANMLAERIIQLGGTPILKPENWYKLANCQYLPPEDPFIKPVLKQNVAGEQCAIVGYNEIAEMTKLKDHVTYEMIVEILKKEVEHENDLQMLLEDLERI